MWVVDEPACIMHWDANRTEYVHSEAKHAAYRYILTGLLSPESPLDVFSQFWFLDWRLLGHRNYFSFRSRYAVLKRVDYRSPEIRERDSGGQKINLALVYVRQSQGSWCVTKGHDPAEPEFWLNKKYAEKTGDTAPGNRPIFRISRWLAEDLDLVERKLKGGTDVVVSYKNVEELTALVAAASYRVRKDDVLDLPPKIYMPLRWVDPTPEQERMYRELVRFATTELEGQHVTAQMVLDQLGKLAALVCGHVTGEDGVVIDVPSNRIQAILDILSDYSGKAVIWAPYPRFLRKIADALIAAYGLDSTVCYWGETPQEERRAARQRIQTDPKCRFMVANQDVGGEGNTWTAANLVIYAANGPRNRARQQSEDRTHRIGQKHSVTYIDLACRGTVDEKWVNTIRSKMDLAAALAGDTWREWVV